MSALSRVFRFTAALLLASAPLSAAVAGPFLVENVNDEPDAFGGVPPGTLVEVAGRTLLFRPFPSGDPREPGVWLLGDDDATPIDLPEALRAQYFPGVTPDGGTLFFTAPAPDSNRSGLYATDGTASGTRFLDRIQGFPETLYLSPRTGLLYFQGRSDLDGVELRVTDGTPGGTRLVHLFEPGTRLKLGVETDDFLFFLVDRSRGADLYRTDGTDDGTLRVADNLTFVTELYATDQRVVYLGNVPDFSTEVFGSDGTPGGAVQLTELDGGTADFSFHVAGSRVYVLYQDFSRKAVLRVTDGTLAGTRVLAEFGFPEDFLRIPYNSRNIVGFADGSLLFDGFAPETGIEPWVSDGTVTGTRLLADLCPGPCDSLPQDPVPAGDGVFFSADDGALGRELTYTDGRVIRRVSDLCPGPCSSVPRVVASRASTVYWLGDDGDGEELFATRAEPRTPVVRLTDFATRLPFLGPVTATASGIYFDALTPDGQAFLYRADGAARSFEPLLSQPVTVRELGSLPRGFCTFRGDLFFAARADDRTLGLYRRRPDREADRVAILDRFDLFLDARIQSFATENHVLVFTRTRGGSGQWSRLTSWSAADGTATILVDRSHIDQAWSSGGRVFFYGSDRNQLWVTDGTPAGTRIVDEHLAFRQPGTPAGDRLVYSKDGARNGALWITDGTTDGTARLLDLEPLGLRSAIDLQAAGPWIFFLGIGEDDTLRLYVTDGSVAGTRPLSPDGVRVEKLVGVFGERVFFEQSELDIGRHLWVSRVDDGEATHLLDVSALYSSGPIVPTFPAIFAEHFWYLTGAGQLIRTDGTVAGTSTVFRQLGDPGRFGQLVRVPGHLLLVDLESSRGTLSFVAESEPDRLVPLREFSQIDLEFQTLGDRTYFAAEGEPDSIGTELWAVGHEGAGPPGPPPPNGPLSAPADFRAEGRSEGVLLTWRDTSSNEARFVVERRAPIAKSDWKRVHTVSADTTSLRVPFLFAPQLFRIRAENADGASAWVETPGAPLTPHGCDGEIPGAPTLLCLQDGRFAVDVSWRSDLNGTDGVGTAAPFDFSDDSGTFWFFDRDNVELVVKVLDARPVNGHFWNFYGALSDVEYWVTVTDRDAGTNVTYYNPPREICGQADVTAFPRLSVADPLHLDRVDSGSCIPDDDTLCLTPDRYRATVTWRDQRSGDTGVGHAIPGTEDSGYFWFFDPANVELVVKVLDGTPVNGFRWVFYGALTDVEYTLTVTDTETGETKQYTNPPGNICGEADVRAF